MGKRIETRGVVGEGVASYAESIGASGDGIGGREEVLRRTRVGAGVGNEKGAGVGTGVGAGVGIVVGASVGEAVGGGVGGLKYSSSSKP